MSLVYVEQFHTSLIWRSTTSRQWTMDVVRDVIFTFNNVLVLFQPAEEWKEEDQKKLITVISRFNHCKLGKWAKFC